MMIIFYITKQYLLLQVRRGGDLRIVWRKQIMSTTVKNEPTTLPPPLWHFLSPKLEVGGACQILQKVGIIFLTEKAVSANVLLN